MKIYSLNIWLFLFLSIFPLSVYTQINKTDSSKLESLKLLLLQQSNDTQKVKTLIEISGQFPNNRDSAKKYAKDAISLSQKLKFKKGEGLGYFHYATALMGTNYYGEQGQINEVVNHFDTAIVLFEQTGNELQIADCYSRISGAYSSLEQNYPEALKNMLAALKIYEKYNEKRRMASCYRSLGSMYFFESNRTEGIQMMNNALRIYEEINDSGQIAYSHNGIGLALLDDRKYDEALNHFATSLAMYKKLGVRGQVFGIPWTQGNIGNVYMMQGEDAISDGNTSLASLKLKDALSLFKERLDAEVRGNMSHRDSYFQLGNCYLNLSKITSATERLNVLSSSQHYYKLALDIAQKTNDKSMFLQVYYKLAFFNETIGDFKSAYQNYKNYILYRDSINSEEVAQKATQIKMGYEFDKRETVARIEQEKKDSKAARTRNLQYTLIGFFLVLALFLFWYNRQKHKAKNKIEKAYSELKSTQTQLIHSEKMASLGELTAGIAHEIQNPLNFVNNFSEISNELIDEMNTELDKGDIEEVKVIASDIKQNLEKINHHGKRADAIVKGMLQHSRSSTGQKELTDINALCDEYLRLAYHGLRAKDKSFNAKFETSFDESIGKINIVPQEIGRVVLNLINNAFYAVTEKKKLNPETYEPTVIVKTSRITPSLREERSKEGRGAEVEIIVKDNGIGIPPKVLDKVFQPFFTTKPTGQGTGLGLSLSYDIITKGHCGELKVETKEGEGSKFIIQLPATV